jgi:hypothetical protein
VEAAGGVSFWGFFFRVGCDDRAEIGTLTIVRSSLGFGLGMRMFVSGGRREVVKKCVLSMDEKIGMRDEICLNINGESIK